MRRSILLLTLLVTALWSALLSPPQAQVQQRSQLGPLCTTDTTPADQQIDTCNKILALKVDIAIADFNDALRMGGPPPSAIASGPAADIRRLGCKPVLMI